MHNNVDPSRTATPCSKDRRQLIVVATFDSFLKAALPIADHLCQRGYDASFVLARARLNQISQRQLATMGFHGLIETKPLTEIVADPSLYQADAVLLAMDGARTSEFLYRFRAGLPADARRRPITLAGYPGVVFQCAIHGLANRSGCDLLLLNSPADFEQYLAVSAAFGADASNALCFGLTILADTPRRLPAARPPRTVLFLEQPDIPRHKVERLYLIDRLVEYARRNPERRVLVKPRHRQHETTLKRTTFHLEPVIERVRRAGRLPQNVELTYQPVEQLLEETDLCLTVSSTAALQAAALGVPCGIIADFGIREDYGTHFFAGSGCVVSFDDIIHDRFPTLVPRWCERHILAARHSLPKLARRIEELLAIQTATGKPMPFQETLFDLHRTAYLRYRFDGEIATGWTACGGGLARDEPARATSSVPFQPAYRKLCKLIGTPHRFFADLTRKHLARLHQGAAGTRC